MIKYLNKIRIAKISLLLLCLVQGCNERQSVKLDSSFAAKKQIYTYPGPLYLKESPYKKLYVEIDSIEGTNIPDVYIDTIRSFLSLHCSKPQGIKIIQNAPVKIKYKNLPIEYISILCMDGPVNEENNTAYLHFFFYDSSQGLVSLRKNPLVISDFPTTVFFNVSYIKNDLNAQLHAIKHELGHALGLCKNPVHGDETHCKNRCLMRARIHSGIATQLIKLFGQSNKGGDLCEDCLVDIERIKSEAHISNLNFSGPFSIREEEVYLIASVMSTYIIIPSMFAEKFDTDWQRVLLQLKEYVEEKIYNLTDESKIAALKSNRMTTFIAHYHSNYGLKFDFLRDHALIEKMKSDPCGTIKAVAYIMSSQLNDKNTSNN